MTMISAAYEERVWQTLRELGISPSNVTQVRGPLHRECAGAELVSIGLDRFGREQRLERRTAARWQSMLAATEVDAIKLEAISGFRSFDYQRQLIERKLAAGLTVEQIVRVNALPGFSEHHTGRAIDIGTPGSPPVTAEFEQTPAFGWLTQRGQDFGFRMTYPRDNPFGIIYEPWHWLCEEPAA